MNKKKKGSLVAVWVAALILTAVGAVLVGSPGGEKESIKEAMRDAVLHERNVISLFGIKNVNPAFISALCVTGILLLFAAVVKAAHTAADGKISRPEHRAQIGQVKGGLSAEPDFPENKGRKALCAEDHGGNAAQPAGIGLFQHDEKRGEDGIQKSLYRKIPRHSVQAEPETAGGNPCLQQKNAYNKLRCTGEHPAGRGLRQKPLQHK